MIINLERDTKELEHVINSLEDLTGLETVMQDKKRGMIMQVRR